METNRLQHRDQDAVNYLTSLPVERRQHPAINVPQRNKKKKGAGVPPAATRLNRKPVTGYRQPS